MAIVFPNNTITDMGPGLISYPGNVVQIVEQQLNVATSFYNWSTQNVLGTATITPTATTSKILVYVQSSFAFDPSAGQFSMGFWWLLNTTQSTTLISSGWQGVLAPTRNSFRKSYLDSPNSIATQTYSLRIGNYPAGSGTFYTPADGAVNSINYHIIRLTEYAT
jgi:hypothetical protein